MRNMLSESEYMEEGVALGCISTEDMEDYMDMNKCVCGEDTIKDKRYRTCIECGRSYRKKHGSLVLIKKSRRVS